MANRYVEDGYVEEDYLEEIPVLTPLPDPPSRGQKDAVFNQKADAFIGAWPVLVEQMNAAIIAFTANSTTATATDTRTIADTGTVAFVTQIGKSYVIGMTVRAAAASDGTTWMQGDVTAYDAVTGALVIEMNAKQGSGSYSDWVLTLSAAAGVTQSGSLMQDFSVKSLTHAIGANIPSASTINLSTATGNFVHVTGNAAIGAATMTAGKDVWVIFDGAPQLTYHPTNHRLNNGGANIAAQAGGIALYTYDGTTVRVVYFAPNGKANTETAPPVQVPVGSCLVFFGSSPPPNYLVCPTAPANISRVTYSALFAAIGTTWGAGDGSTTFGIPWFAADHTMVQANSNVGSQTPGEVKEHLHPYDRFTLGGGGTGTGGSNPTLVNTTPNTGLTGGAANLAAGSRVLICVKYQNG